jgi:hypothetical protein
MSRLLAEGQLLPVMCLIAPYVGVDWHLIIGRHLVGITTESPVPLLMNSRHQQRPAAGIALQKYRCTQSLNLSVI